MQEAEQARRLGHQELDGEIGASLGQDGAMALARDVERDLLG